MPTPQTNELSAVALAMRAYVDGVPLGPRAARLHRELATCARQLQGRVDEAASAPTVRRRRTCYERGHEVVASFAFVLLHLRDCEQIDQRDFDEGRRLARLAKTLLDARLAAFETVVFERPNSSHACRWCAMDLFSNPSCRHRATERPN